MWRIVGNCPRCGAPIWSRWSWGSELHPPPYRRSCACFILTDRPGIGYPMPEPPKDSEPDA